MPQPPPHFVERRADAFIGFQIAVNDALGLRRWIGRPFAIEANLGEVFPDPINERAADQPAAAGDDGEFPNLFQWSVFLS